MEIGEFHWTHGIYFKRMDDGAVRLRIAGGDNNIVLETIPAAEWASIVAHVAKGGEAENYAKAVALHG